MFLLCYLRLYSMQLCLLSPGISRDFPAMSLGTSRIRALTHPHIPVVVCGDVYLSSFFFFLLPKKEEHTLTYRVHSKNKIGHSCIKYVAVVFHDNYRSRFSFL